MSSVSSRPTAAKPLVAVDVRMAHHSGIGRYIRETMPRVRALLPDVRWRWVGRARQPWMRLDQRDTEFFPWPAPIYGWREHVPLPAAFARTGVGWIPHYNLAPGGPRRVVVTLHDLLPLRQAQGWRGRLRAGVFRIYLHRIRRRAALVLTNSSFTASELSSVGGIPSRRIRVTPLGTTVLPTPSAEATPDCHGCFVFLGNIKPHKNLPVLLSAWEQLAPRMAGRLLIVGRKEGFFTGEKRCADRIAALGPKVEFVGEVGDHVLGSILRKATALVLPSLYEGFGLPILEAMAAGCPVIAAEAAALPEVGGPAALYFPSDDATLLAAHMQEVAENAVLRETLRQAGLERARSFTWDHTAELTAAALREVLGS